MRSAQTGGLVALTTKSGGVRQAFSTSACGTGRRASTAAAGNVHISPASVSARARGGRMTTTAAVSTRQGLAAEYHSSDFDWEELWREAEPIVRQQAEIGRQRLAQAPEADVAGSAASAQHTDTTTQPETAAASAARTHEEASTSEPSNAWDDFYSTTARSAKFFRERRYLLLEFPILNTSQPQHVVELGCGYGPSLLPILRTNPNARVTGTDIAPTCIQQLQEFAATADITGHEDRVSTFVADSASTSARHLFEPLQADVALIMFTLSAVPPEGQVAMLANAWAALRPGGYLCIRDHGLYDMVQLRIPGEQWLGENMYRRGDGTLAYFFSIEDILAKARAAGFTVEECEYVTVYNHNRKTGQKLKRVFVHCLFRKPEG